MCLIVLEPQICQSNRLLASRRQVLTPDLEFLPQPYRKDKLAHFPLCLFVGAKEELCKILITHLGTEVGNHYFTDLSEISRREKLPHFFSK